MINPSRLATARKRLGWTIRRLSDETGVSSQSLSAYENGHHPPSNDTLLILAEKLRVLPRFLTGGDLDEIQLGAVSFRALSKMTARTRDRGLASGRVGILINEWIEERYNLPEPNLPTLTGRAPESAAEELRARWGLGERPLGNLVHLLEAHGVRVYALTHGNSDLDAFSLQWHEQPFVFLGTDKSPERGRFDAAHELGHLILHAEDTSPHGVDAEREANRFAAAFLMPRADVLARGLVGASVNRVLDAKRRWDVAAIALAHRLNELGLLTEWGYRSLCVDLARLGYRKDEPSGMSAREGSQLLTKVLQHLRTAGFGISDIARDLGVCPQEVQSHLLGLTPTVVPRAGPTDALRDPRRPSLHLL